MEEHRKNILMEVKAHVMTLKALIDEASGLSQVLCDSFQRTM